MRPLDEIHNLDRMVHEPARLAILTVLAAAEDVEFLFLQQATGLTKGNLSSHSQKLEEAGYIEVRKGYRDRIPSTTFRITTSGARALEAYWAAMKRAMPPR